MLKDNIKCPICKTKDFSILLELPDYPLTELFHNSERKKKFLLTKSNQAFCFCESCNHGFLKTIIDPNYLYQKDNYNTISTNSKGAMISLTNFAEFINKSNSYCSDFVIDIGGNDSNLLDQVKAKRGAVIDPNSKTSKPEYKALSFFFEHIDPKELESDKISVVSSHTLEHIENPYSFFNFLKGIKNVKSFYLQFPSLELMIESRRFDLIHHQHIHYYSLVSIQKLAKQYDLKILRYEYDYDHYGVLRVELSKDNNQEGIEFCSGLYKSDFISELIESFKIFTKYQNSFLDQFQNINCYGASLMLPITFYYYPNLKKSQAILDADISKSTVSYVNIDVPIIHDNNNDLKNSLVFITANATRYANRIILKNLIDRNPQYLINPFPTN